MRKYNEDGMKFIIVAYLGIDSGDLKKVNDPKVLKKIVSQFPTLAEDKITVF